MSWPTELTKHLIGPLALSFETGEQSATKIYFNHQVRVRKVRSIVVKALAATDNGTITVATAAGTVCTLTHAASAALNSEQSADGAEATNRIPANGWLMFTTAKTTVGGKILVTAEVETEI
jgi:hypothetical protein